MTKGFTLVELLVTIVIFSLLVALGLFMSMEAYRGASYRSERDTIVSLLQRARSRAMANLYQSQWSVCYLAPDYVIAKGTACNATTAYDRIEANAAVVATSDFSDFPVVFDQVTGNSASVGPVKVIRVRQGTRDESITINHEGTILW
jgi:prepilin-type N-terminal cleavage/methylation domain-containing protein